MIVTSTLMFHVDHQCCVCHDAERSQRDEIIIDVVDDVFVVKVQLEVVVVEMLVKVHTLAFQCANAGVSCDDEHVVVDGDVDDLFIVRDDTIGEVRDLCAYVIAVLCIILVRHTTVVVPPCDRCCNAGGDRHEDVQHA